MTTAETLGVTVTVVTAVACYRLLVSPSVRALSRWASRENAPASAGRRRLLLGLVTAAVVLPAALVPLHRVPAAGPLRWFLAFVLALLTWQSGTADYDLSRPLGPQRRGRLLLVASAVGAYAWPPLLLGWLAVACGGLGAWQHHRMMPLRVLKAHLAWFLSVAALEASIGGGHVPGAADGLLIVLGCVSLSHYLKPAWSKARLGRRWWSWAWENRTHYLAAAAYCWGWARFLPPDRVVATLRLLRRTDRPFNIVTMAVETAALTAFLDRRLLAAVLAATVLFNLGVFLASGILFWENMGTNAALAATVASGPSYGGAFGWTGLALAVPVLLLAVADVVWRPWELGWWDTPFTARVHWEVTTASGRRHGLYSDFMFPYEREFSRTLSCGLVEEPLLHGHVGTVLDSRLRDELADANGDPDVLNSLKQRYGTVRWDPVQARQHIDFLRVMFTRLNAGAPRGPLPHRLRRLRDPGGHILRGELPPYTGVEPVLRITIRYQERCYRPAHEDIVLLADRVLCEIDLPAPGSPAPGWPTARIRPFSGC